MKIYQIHKYEDELNIIVASYLDKSKTENEKKRLCALFDEVFEDGYKCESCPFAGARYNELEALKFKYPNYCNHFEAKVSNDHKYWNCMNFCLSEPYFDIQEVEVKE